MNSAKRPKHTARCAMLGGTRLRDAVWHPAKNVSRIAAGPNPRWRMAKQNGQKQNTRKAADAAELPEAFGPRLASLRKAAGYTQEEFAEAIGVSRRVIGYYEAESADTPPGSMLVAIAQVLTVSVDELLGLKRLPKGKAFRGPHGNSRLMRKLKQLEQLPKAQQQAVIQHIDPLSQTHGGEGKGKSRR